MSVQSESLTGSMGHSPVSHSVANHSAANHGAANHGKISPMEQFAEFEDGVSRAESIAIFASAIGGAILGVLLTLLVLALINNGSLRFVDGETIDQFQANLTRIDENVGAVSKNIDIVAGQLKVVDEQLNEFELLQGESVGELQEIIGGLDESITKVDTARQQIDAFINALAAMSTIDPGESEQLVE